MIIENTFSNTQTKPTHPFATPKAQTKALQEALSPEKTKTGVSLSCENHHQGTG